MSLQFNAFDTFSYFLRSISKEQWIVGHDEAVCTLDIILFLMWCLKHVIMYSFMFSEGTGNLGFDEC
jgi:hypothetical protein